MLFTAVEGYPQLRIEAFAVGATTDMGGFGREDWLSWSLSGL